MKLIPPLGGPRRKIAEIQVRWIMPVSPGFIAWCPESDCLIVIDSPGEGRPAALFSISLDTGEKRQLTHPQPPVFGDSNPVVSPDGRTLGFQRNPSGPGAELYSLPLQKDLTAAGERRRLTAAAMNATGPAWMPDSREILFSAGGSLWRLAVTGGSAPTRLPFVGEYGVMPAVSRQSPGRPQRLVYVRSFTDRNIWQLQTRTLGAASSSQPVVVIASTRDDEGAQISPDGRRVAFGSDRSGEREIWVADPDGANAMQLTSMGAEGTAGPRWSHDGQTIVFNSNVDGQQDIYVVAAGGGKPRRVTAHHANDIQPSFSRDDKTIYFVSNEPEDFRSGRLRRPR